MTSTLHTQYTLNQKIQVQVYWHDDDEWFTGVLSVFTLVRLSHTVRYGDVEHEPIFMAHQLARLIQIITKF